MLFGPFELVCGPWHSFGLFILVCLIGGVEDHGKQSVSHKFLIATHA